MNCAKASYIHKQLMDLNSAMKMWLDLKSKLLLQVEVSMVAEMLRLCYNSISSSNVKTGKVYSCKRVRRIQMKSLHKKLVVLCGNLPSLISPMVLVTHNPVIPSPQISLRVKVVVQQARLTLSNCYRAKSSSNRSKGIRKKLLKIKRWH